MNILSIHSGHNAVVAYFEDGECKKFFHEEKFNNIKNYSGFPHEALECLAGLYDFSKIDYVTFPYTDVLWLNVPRRDKERQKAVKQTFYEGNMLENLSRGSAIRRAWDFIEYYMPLKGLFFSFRNFIVRTFISPKVKKATAKYLNEKYGFKPEQLKYYDHHFTHATSTIYFYNLKNTEKDILIFSMDGAGDGSFAKVYIYRKGAALPELVASSDFSSSIGLLYSGVTRHLGMKQNEHEYKVMGLAAYVNEEKYFKSSYDKFAKIIKLDEKTLKFRSKFNINLMISSGVYLKDNFTGVRFDNISAALQKFTEDIVIKWIKAGVKKTGVRDIACTGGVFMNVKMNQRIQQIEEIEKVYFMPSCGDESTVLGSAPARYYEEGVKTKSDSLMYKGHEYTNDEVEKFLKERGYFEKYKITKCSDTEKETALLLKDYKIVARFQGPGEWGARSLCNRTILGNASDLKTFYEVNDMIKMRDFWMPFAPTLLDSWADKYIKNWNFLKTRVEESSRYMITSFDSTKLAQEHLRAAIHQKDKTLRPQILFEKDNSRLYKLFKYYEEMTGMGGMMNTSLNIHGYPLVGTLEQAMFTFENSGLIYMTAEDFLISKNK